MEDRAAQAFVAIAEGAYLEGLAWDAARNVVWYSDVLAGGVHGVRSDGARYGAFDPERMWTGGVMMNACGAVLSSGAGGIRWNRPDTGASGWLLQDIGGEAINGVNEMWPDGSGGIFFGTVDIENVAQAQPTRPTALYRLTTDRQVIQIADAINFSNGLAYDPVRERFYCSDTFNVAWVWDVKPDKTLANRRVLLEQDDCDGLALDSLGNVWITGFRTFYSVTRLSPAGTVLPPVPIPAGAATQVRFGGTDLRDLYVNVVPAGGGDSLKDGQPVTSVSRLYRGRTEVPGLAVEPARFNLV